MNSIDINCDMGEGVGNDEQLMPFISSANIACGFHAGDEETMKRTIESALKHEVAIGAHPGFDDKKNFGRVPIQLEKEQLVDLLRSQIDILGSVADKFNAKLHHVKPHGALYNMAAQDSEMAFAIAQSVKNADPNLILYGLSGSSLISEAKAIGLRTSSEVFADRTYNDDGSLTPRSHINALLEKEQDVVEQVLRMVKTENVESVKGNLIPIVAETICIHGDGKHALTFARAIFNSLKQHGIAIKAV